MWDPGGSDLGKWGRRRGDCGGLCWQPVISTHECTVFLSSNLNFFFSSFFMGFLISSLFFWPMSHVRVIFVGPDGHVHTMSPLSVHP